MPSKKRSDAKDVYAGFWLRFVANFIDSMLFLPVSWAVLYLLFSTEWSFFQCILFFIIISTLLDAAYEILLTSRLGGTLGKIMLGIKVVDEKGNKLSLGMSTGRYFSKLISCLILFIGFLMIAWDKKKQGLHDHIMDSYVVDSKNKWQNRRKYVIIIFILLILGYYIYSFSVGMRSAFETMKFDLTTLDKVDSIKSVTAYCENRTSDRDSCYDYYAKSDEYFKFENLSVRIDMCNKIRNDDTHKSCIMTLAIKESDPSVCNSSRSKYAAHICTKIINLFNDFIPNTYKSSSPAGYNDSLTAQSIDTGYLHDSQCIQNNISVYEYSDSVCILSKKVSSFKQDKDGKHWVGLILDVTRQDNNKTIRISYNMFKSDLNIYLPENSYDGYYSFFNASNLVPGNYIINYTIYDLIGKQKINFIKTITITDSFDYGKLKLEASNIGLDYNTQFCTFSSSSIFDDYARICLRPKVSGFQKLSDGTSLYNMDMVVSNINGTIYHRESDIFKDQPLEYLVDGVLDGPYAIVYAYNYPSGEYIFNITVKDLVSRKEVVVEKHFMIRD